MLAFCFLVMMSCAHAQNVTRMAAQESALAIEVDMLFDARLARAEAYSSWVYEWAASYLAAYKIAARVLVSLVANPSGWTENVQKPLGAYYREEVRKRVIHPEADSNSLVEMIDRHAAARLFVLARTAASEACAGSVGSACNGEKISEFDALAHAVMVQRRGPAARVTRQAALREMIDTNAHEDLYLFRAIRPLASRTIIFLLRLTELASIGILISALLRRLAVPNTWPLQVLVALIIAWGLDFTVHEFDRLLHQAEFKSSFERSIDLPRARLLDYIHGEIVLAENHLRERIIGATRP